MRFCKYVFAAVWLMMSLSACSLFEEANDDPDTHQADPDFLVMLYGVGGGNLDQGILTNVLELMYAGSDSKVKYTIQYKLSANEQVKYDQCFGGVRRMTGDENLELKSKTVKYPDLSDDDYSKTLSKIKSERFADKQYDMTTSQALTDFIKWSKQQYPTAKRTLLIINDHGMGWELENDGKQDDAGTRGILFDDNTESSSLSANEVMKGVQDAGRVDLIYTDACLMSMYENIYAYAEASKFLLTSVETTPGVGGDYFKLMRLLKAAEGSDAGLESAMKQYVDYCVSKEWWGMNDGDYDDLAFYDLEKVKAQCTPVLKRIAETLAEKYVSEESINPTTEELLLGEYFTPYIRVAVYSCMVTFGYRQIAGKMVEAFAPYLKKDGIKADKEGYYSLRELLEWSIYARTAGAQEAYEAMPEQFANLQLFLMTTSNRVFSLTDLLRNLCNELDEVGAQNNPFASLRAELLAALKTSGHIACTKPDKKPGIDQEYELCSPGIFIAPLNDLLLSGKYPAFDETIPSVEDGLRYYQNTVFDQQVGWSHFLQELDVIPNAMNPMRQYVK